MVIRVTAKIDTTSGLSADEKVTSKQLTENTEHSKSPSV